MIVYVFFGKGFKRTGVDDCRRCFCSLAVACSNVLATIQTFLHGEARQDMFEHQKNHIERITNHLKRGWRDYIIAEACQLGGEALHAKPPMGANEQLLKRVVSGTLFWLAFATPNHPSSPIFTHHPFVQVLDKLSDDYNFFSDDFEKHMQSPLHALLRKLDSWMHRNIADVVTMVETCQWMPRVLGAIGGMTISGQESSY